MLRIVSWNLGRRAECWERLLAEDGPDVALVQEATAPPRAVPWSTPTLDARWVTGRPNSAFCAAVVGLREGLRSTPLVSKGLGEINSGELGASVPGTIAAVEVETRDGDSVILVSVYSLWQSPVVPSSWKMLADASAHRLVSDVSTLIGRQRGHKIIVAGDWNILHGYGEDGSDYWGRRYQTVFDRMAAIGLPFVGPQHRGGQGGRLANPWPDELPKNSENVPTFKPASGWAARQVDYVFASEELRDRLAVTALNSPEDWGTSDHCQVLIELR